VKPPVILALVLVVALTAACRQPDGSLPPLDEQDTNRISDLAHDLQAIAGGDVSAHKDFAQDLVVFVDPHAQEAQTTVLGFAGRLAEAVASAKLTEQSAQQLAHTTWSLVGATEMSDRQIRAMQVELRTQLSASGVGQERVDAIAAEIPTVQRAVTTRPRRWFEVL